LHLAVDSHGLPVRLILTEGTTADCSEAIPLIDGIQADYLLADKGYDTNEIVATVVARGIEPVIPPKSNRREPRNYDRDLYKLRHLVENAFLQFKQWRGVATRYAKRGASFLAICQIRALVLWTKLF
jgi:transposase